MLNIKYKNIHDNIHGYIPLSNYAMYIIDTPEFQRLRGLKQLGTCIYVFDNANHSRFEHSIGTYYLVSLILNNITKNLPLNISSYLSTIHELKNYFLRKYGSNIYVFDEYIQELIKIAGLCHDLGHGPYSHIFDDNFLTEFKELDNHVNRTHEARSYYLLKKIIKEHEILKNIISDDEINFMGNLINPRKQDTGFVFQIVSNYLNGLDVDKYDYIYRDSYMLGLKTGFDYSRLVNDVRIINNNICYPESIVFEIYKLYQARYSLHKQIYSHKSVISSQLMIVELFKLLDPVLNIKNSINNLNDFCKLTDSYIMNSVDLLLPIYESCCDTSKTPNKLGVLSEKEKDNEQEKREKLLKAKIIIDRLNCHNLYKYIGSNVYSKKKIITIDDFKKDLSDNTLNNIVIFQSKIGFVSGNKKNPIDNIYSYESKIPVDSAQQISKKINFNEVSMIMPKYHQEFITLIFYKDRNDIEGFNQVKNIFENM
jgi:HD superfamily phosphohydrolase